MGPEGSAIAEAEYQRRKAETCCHTMHALFRERDALVDLVDRIQDLVRRWDEPELRALAGRDLVLEAVTGANRYAERDALLEAVTRLEAEVEALRKPLIQYGILSATAPAEELLGRLDPIFKSKELRAYNRRQVREILSGG